MAGEDTVALHVELVPELEVLVQAEPLRERPRAQLMLALYRSGRQADALAGMLPLSTGGVSLAKLAR